MKTQTNATKTTTKKIPNIMGLVDRLSVIEDQLESMEARKLIKESEEIKKALREHIADAGYNDDDPVFLLGNTAEVEFSPCTRERIVDNKKLLKKYLGSENFDRLAKFSIKDLEQHLPKSKIETCISEVYGSRKIRGISLLTGTVH